MFYNSACVHCSIGCSIHPFVPILFNVQTYENIAKVPMNQLLSLLSDSSNSYSDTKVTLSLHWEESKFQSKYQICCILRQ